MLPDCIALLQVACLIRVPSEVVKQRAQVSPSASTFRILSHTLYHEVSSEQNFKEVASFFPLMLYMCRSITTILFFLSTFPKILLFLEAVGMLIFKGTKPHTSPMCVHLNAHTCKLQTTFPSSFYIGHLRRRRKKKKAVKRLTWIYLNSPCL